MDCRTALEILEVVRPDSADRMEPEVVSASDHVENCRRCEDHFLARRHFDRRVGESMRDVPVPSGLKSRLLTALEAPQSSEERGSQPPADALAGDATGPEHDAPVSLAAVDAASARLRRGRHRARILSLASTALLFAAAVTFLVVQSSQSPVWTMAELRHEAATAFQDFGELPTFDGDFEARLPEIGWETSRAIGIESARGFPAGAAPHAAALYYFRLRDGRRGQVDGILLVTPKQNVAEPPQKRNFSAQGVGSGPLSTDAWTEGEFVYVCVIRGGGDGPQRLESALRLTQAA